MPRLIDLRRPVVLASALSAACGGLGGVPPDQLPIVKGADGREYRLMERGAYKAFYDRWGRLQRIEYDSDGDGRADRIAHHDGTRLPHLIEVDEDFDGSTDRWEDYDAEGTLVRVGVSRRGGSPDLWNVLGPGGQARRRDYDDDGDGRVDRSELLGEGQRLRLEVDADRDGRPDRWQDWRKGRLVSEELDTDGDGRADRRLLYGPDGVVQSLRPLESDAAR